MKIDELVINPSLHFETPENVLKTDKLNKQQKEIALKNWKQHLVHLQESTAEGMSVKNLDKNEEIQKVNQAMQLLKEK